MSECTHPDTTIEERRRKKSNGAIVIARQCLICGRSRGEVSKEGRILAKLNWFDESLITRWDAQERAEYDQRQQQRNEEFRNRTGKWWEDYGEYLRSDHWRIVRGLVLERDTLCQKCFSARSTEAHHLSYETYKKRGFSYVSECVGLCHDCHAEETAASIASRLAAEMRPVI